MPTLRDHVLTASTHPEVRQAVARVYEDLQREIDARKPVCSASGRCCRFDEFGHRLYVTTIELAVFVSQLTDDHLVRAGLCESGSSRSEERPAGPGGACPFQLQGLCSVHTLRPFGCRVFFCDSTSDDWQHAQYERFHADLKRLHEQLDVPYQYLEWRQALRELGWMPGTGIRACDAENGPAGAAKPLSLPQLRF